jgi:flagellar motor switch protein FliN/FliY
MDAMLNAGGGEGLTAARPAPVDTRALSDLEQELLGSIADVMNAMTGFSYKVTGVEYATIAAGEIRDLLRDDIIFKSAVTVDKQAYSHYYVYELQFARSIAAALTGGDEDPAAELNEMQESALLEVVSQANGSYLSSISSVMKLATDSEAIVRSDIDGLAGDVVDGHLMSTITLENSEGSAVSIRHVICGQLAGIFMKQLNGEDDVQQAAPAAFSDIPPQHFGNDRTVQTQAPAASPPAPGSGRISGGQTEYQPAHFSQINESRSTADLSNLDILLDVPLQVTVELGKTVLPIKQILEYGQGSLITLDKLAGEPIDLLVNGKYFAKGEVVVIDENFGVRITSILSPADRLAQLS